MGHYLTRYWQPDGQGMNKAERMGGAYHPYVPNRLTGSSLALEPSCAKAVAEAQKALYQLDTDGTLTDTESLARLLLRAEAVSSSRIEGLEMPASKLLEYEELDRLGVDHRLDGTEAQVLGNLHALTENVEALAQRENIAVEDIYAIHTSLLKGTRMEEFCGKMRTTQNWIGGNRVNPIGAAYVPPEPEEIPMLMDDLVEFVNSSELPTVAIAALAHAQLETIHPFADGNGRTGRALIHLVLRSKGASKVTTPPISLIFATDKERYLANLAAYRWEDEHARERMLNDWIEYFAQTVTLSCQKALRFEKSLSDIQNEWIRKTNFRKGSAGRQLLSILPGTPVISIHTAQVLTGKSYPAARLAVRNLEEAGVLSQNAKNRKSGIYVATEIMREFNNYEQSLASLSGDTAAEKPKRKVPQRKRM